MDRTDLSPIHTCLMIFGISNTKLTTIHIICDKELKYRKRWDKSYEMSENYNETSLENLTCMYNRS